MAIIPMIPVGRVTTLNRSILLTERRMSVPVEMILFVDTVGMSCWRISILQQSEAIPSISAAFARTTTTSHSPPAMVAIGLLGDEANRTQLRTVRWNPMATAQESRSDASQTRLRRGFPISPLVCGEISSNRPWYRS